MGCSPCIFIEKLQLTSKEIRQGKFWKKDEHVEVEANADDCVVKSSSHLSHELYPADYQVILVLFSLGMYLQIISFSFDGSIFVPYLDVELSTFMLIQNSFQISV